MRPRHKDFVAKVACIAPSPIFPSAMRRDFADSGQGSCYLRHSLAHRIFVSEKDPLLNSE